MRRVEVCWWGSKPPWTRLARVVQHSARKQCPGWAVNVQQIQPDVRPAPSGSAGQATNTAKLEWWTARVRELPDGDEVLLMDADTMVLRPLDDVWNLDFEVAFTSKPSPPAKYPLNGGVIFLRIGPPARLFMEEWLRQNEEFFVTPKAHRPYWQKYAGMNQAALGRMLTGDARRAKIGELSVQMTKLPMTGTGSFRIVPKALHALREERARLDVRLTHADADSPLGRIAKSLSLPCSEWNAEDTYWRKMNGGKINPRIVHVKSRLRQEAIGVGDPMELDLGPAVKTWRTLEKEAKEAAARAALEATA